MDILIGYFTKMQPTLCFISQQTSFSCSKTNLTQQAKAIMVLYLGYQGQIPFHEACMLIQCICIAVPGPFNFFNVFEDHVM